MNVNILAELVFIMVLLCLDEKSGHCISDTLF